MAELMQLWQQIWMRPIIYAPQITINMPWSGDVKQDMLNLEDDDDA